MSISAFNSNAEERGRQITRGAAKSYVRKAIQNDKGETFSAKEFLARHPELLKFQSCVIDLAYEDYCRQRECGVDVPVSLFVQQFTGVEQSLFRVIEFDQVLQEHPSLIENVPDERWPKAGDDFCGFQLIELIGRGALSRVYVARQTGLGLRQVVVKICVRGEREADLLGKLEHRGIAPVYSIHSDSGTGLAIICMPFLTRPTMHHIAEWLTQRDAEVTAKEVRQEVQSQNEEGIAPATVEVPGDSGDASVNSICNSDSLSTLILKWGVQLATALSYAHSKHVLHCDVKPGNVLLLNSLAASLLDFNLASSADDVLRLAGGTLPYMSSEQLRQLISAPAEIDSTKSFGDELSERTDVFGLCATLWHLASGEPPFGVGADFATRGDAASELLTRQAAGVEEDRLQRIRRVLPEPVVQELLRGLHVEPESRHHDAAALSTAFLQLLPRPKRIHGWRAAIFGVLISFGFVAFAATSDRFGVFRQSAEPAKPTAGEVAVDSLRLIQNRQFKPARELLSTFVSSDSFCQWLDLYCRTCLLQSMTYSKSVEVADVKESELKIAWIDVRVGWENAVKSEQFRAESAMNLAFVNLEFGTDTAFQDAEFFIEEAQSLGLETEASARVSTLLSVLDSSFSGDISNSLQTVHLGLYRSGSRGEFLAYLRVLKHGFESNQGSLLEKFASDALSTLETPERSRAEPNAAELLLCRGLFGHGDLLMRATSISQNKASDDHNRLKDVFVLPKSHNEHEAFALNGPSSTAK